jgi:trk system potassium uptake protein TrkA
VSILIVGGGEIGLTLAERLSSSESKDVVLIESQAERVRDLRELADVQVVHGNGSNPRVLREAGLDDAEMVIAVTNSDEVNLVACLVAARQSVIPTKIARVREPDLAAVAPGFFGEELLDLCINPEEAAAQRLMRTLRFAGAAGVLEYASGKVQVVTFIVDRPCELVGVALADLRKRLGIDCNIVAILRSGKLIIPSGPTRVLRGDQVYAAGSPDGMRNLARALRKDERPVRRVMINGGGHISYALAQKLETEEIAPKIIEQDEDRCKFLVDRLERSVVLKGDGKDMELLREENIDTVDAFLALTQDQEDNILAALMAKRGGARYAVALVDRPLYASLATAIGIDAVVSPKAAAVSDILHFIRKGKVVSVTTIGEDAGEALEIVALETSEIVGKPLREADLRDAIVGAIVRGDELIIPSGDDVVYAGDHVVIFALRSAIPRLERQLTVKLRYF